MPLRARLASFVLIASVLAPLRAASAAPDEGFLKTYCADCHSGAKPEAGLDLGALARDLSGREAFGKWVKVFDRVSAGEMPPKDAPQPTDPERAKFAKGLKADLLAAEAARTEREGRTPIRRLTRTEYEHTLRDLLALDGITLRDGLPEDGSAWNFDRNSEALDISHVNMAKYVEAADKALDMAVAVQPWPPQRQTHRFSLARNIYHILMNGDAVMLKDGKPDTVFAPGGHVAHVGAVEHIHVLRDAEKRGASPGVFRHEDESFKPYFYDFAVLYPGRYRIRTSFWSFGWDKGTVLPGRGTEAARLSVVHLQDDGRGGGHPSTILGYYDAPPNSPLEHELTTWLNFKDTIGFNTASLAPVANYARPGRAMAFTGPGIANDFFEIEGPLHDSWPPEGHRRLFGDLPFAAFDPRAGNPKDGAVPIRAPARKLLRQETQAPNRPDPPSGSWTVASVWPEADADRLLAAFLPRAFRRPVPDEVRREYVAIALARLKAGDCFETAMRAAYRTALCAPDFLYHVERPDRFDDYALAARLSYFLWNSLPDETLLRHAEAGRLRIRKTVQEEVERMLKDPKSDRFVRDFLDQWLNLRRIAANDPDRALYPEFSPYLQDSMLAESRAYFRELLDRNLDARHLVQSDFAMLNEKLAVLYGVPGVSGASVRRVPLPPDSPRGPFLTQAAVLKVTANGTTTSPVPRGAFVMARLLGRPPEPPPPNVPAVEPDVRGATTIREQLDKHRADAVCASCHARIDPPGFALESFDVIGGFRDRYRSIGEGDPAPRGNIDRFIGISFKLGPPVDPSGTLADGREFADVRALQAHLAADSLTLLRNLAEQLCTYATGRPVGFGDRTEIAGLVDRTQKQGGGLRTLIHELVASRLFAVPSPAGEPKPDPLPTALLAATPTRAAPPGVAGLTALPGPPDEAGRIVPFAAQPDRPPIRARLVGLSGPERVADLRADLATAPELRLLEVDPEKHEVLLEYDFRKLYPQAGANHRPSEDQLRTSLDIVVKRVSRGTFSLRPLLGETRANLRREEIALKLADCKGCRLCAYRTAAGVDGVEQAQVDPATGKLTVWLDPAKPDLAPLRDALAKARIELP